MSIVSSSFLGQEHPLHVLRDYALLADGERGALVGPRGDIVWMCAPRWHDDPVFSSLIGGAGGYAVTPRQERYVWGGYYEPGSLIWRSRWVSSTGVAECREALAFPGEPGRVVLLRRVTAVSDGAQLRVELAARHDFGATSMTDISCQDGVWTARSGTLRIRWSGAGAAGWCEQFERWEMDLDLDQGDQHDLVLEISQSPLPQHPPQAERMWQQTEYQWRASVPDLNVSLAHEDTRQSYAVLAGLTSSSGGMVASATMSLPEHRHTRTNYDYRYAWIRDQCYVGLGVAAHGVHPLVSNAVQFVSEMILEHGGDLRPAYRIDGGAVPDERHLDLPGYPGGQDIVGNWVNDQFQLDNFGEALLLLAKAAELDVLDAQGWRAIQACVQVIRQRWQEPDSGIWELGRARWAHSRLICAAGLRAAADQAPARQGAEWVSMADRLVTDTAKDCLHPTGRWQQSPQHPRVDAALLLPAIRGAVSAQDPRSLATLDAVRTDLGRDGYLYRFRHDERPLAQAEGAFILCGLHMTIATAQQGRDAEAVHWFERARSARSTPGLFSEEYDVHQHQLRGNYPQAFVHGVFLEAAARLDNMAILPPAIPSTKLP